MSAVHICCSRISAGRCFRPFLHYSMGSEHMGDRGSLGSITMERITVGRFAMGRILMDGGSPPVGCHSSCQHCRPCVACRPCCPSDYTWGVRTSYCFLLSTHFPTLFPVCQTAPTPLPTLVPSMWLLCPATFNPWCPTTWLPHQEPGNLPNCVPSSC